MFVLLLLAGCFGAPPLDPLAVLLPLDEQAVAGPTGSYVGWSMEAGTRWGVEGDPVHPEWRSPERVAALEALAEVRQGERPPWVRLTGMSTDGRDGADGYHVQRWMDARAWSERGPAADDAMAPAQALDLAEQLGAQVIVPLNLATGTPEEAAAYARHLVGDDPLRAAWRRDVPWTVAWYELGDEVYDAHTTGWDGDVAAYRDRALAVVDAVLAEDPDARFLVPLTRADRQAWGDLVGAVSTLAPLLEHPSVAGVSYHHLQLDDAAALGAADPNSPNLVVAGSALFGVHKVGLDDALAGLNRDEPLQHVVSAYGMAGPDVAGALSLGDTAATGLATADMLVDFANAGMDAAVQRSSLDWGMPPGQTGLSWDRPVRFDQEAVELPATRVARLFGECALDRRLNLAMEGNDPERGGDGSELSPLFPYARIHAAGFVSLDGDHVCYFFLNRNLESGTLLRVELGGEWVLTQDHAWAPEELASNVVSGANADIPVSGPGWRRFSTGLDVDLPAHSVVVLHLER